MWKPCSGSVVTRSPARATAPTGNARSAESTAAPYTCGSVDRTIASNLSARRVRDISRSNLTRTVSPARSATIESRSAVPPTGTTGDTVTRAGAAGLLAPIAAGASDVATVRCERGAVVAESVVDDVV